MTYDNLQAANRTVQRLESEYARLAAEYAALYQEVECRADASGLEGLLAALDNLPTEVRRFLAARELADDVKDSPAIRAAIDRYAPGMARRLAAYDALCKE